VVARFLMWRKMPLHLRWELYPVAHEGKRAAHGGSYLEETDWWKKPREKSMWGELKVMVPEILFLAALREHNPSQWIRSFPFHFGLYLVIGCTVLMGLTGLFGIESAALRYAVVVLGVGGMVLALLGALGLLQRRLMNAEYRDFTSASDIFNLLFFVVAFGCAFLHFVLADLDFARTQAVVTGLVTFGPVSAGVEVISPLTSATVILLAVLMAYIPLTHMSHFVGKFFAYHAIRWDDQPNLRGSEYEPVIQKQLGQRVSWAAPHIQGEGKKTWVDLATEKAKQ